MVLFYRKQGSRFVFPLRPHTYRMAGNGLSFTRTFETINKMHLFITYKMGKICFRQCWRALSYYLLSTVNLDVLKFRCYRTATRPCKLPYFGAAVSEDSDLFQFFNYNDSSACVCNQPHQRDRWKANGCHWPIVSFLPAPWGNILSFCSAKGILQPTCLQETVWRQCD